MHGVCRKLINTWPFNIDSFGFCESPPFVDGTVLDCPFMLENKVTTLAQLAFPHVPEPRSSLLSQLREAQDWQLPVECPDWWRWNDGIGKGCVGNQGSPTKKCALLPIICFLFSW